MRLVCHASPLPVRVAQRMQARWGNAHPMLLETIEEVADRAAASERIVFSLPQLSGTVIQWQWFTHRRALIQEREQDVGVRVIHRLSFGPTGEVWWERRVLGSEGGSAPSAAILVTAFMRAAAQRRRGIEDFQRRTT